MAVIITEFADNNAHHWDTDTGMPTISTFGNAVQVWAVAQDRATTITEAAQAFNVATDLVRAAVEEHPWMYVGAGDKIEHDGE